MLHWIRRTAAVAAGLLIIVLSLAPDTAPAAFDSDKTRHLLAYGGWTFIVALSPRPLGRLGLYALLILSTGVAVELLQPYFGRTCSLGDLLANLGGVLIGGALGLSLRWAARYRPISRSPGS